MKRTLLLGLVGLVALVVVLAAIFAYALIPPPVRLTVVEGSAVGVIEGNLTSISSIPGLVLVFEATTYANQSGSASSIVNLRVWTDTYYVAGSGDVEIEVLMNISGRLAANLHPTTVVAAVNQSGPFAVVRSLGPQAGLNVSFDAAQYITLVDNASGSLSATLVNQGGTYNFFGYSLILLVDARPWYNRFLGFRAGVSGQALSVGVTVLLKIINDAGGIWV